jgi:hypothetical protein
MADWGAGVSPNGGGTGSVIQSGDSAVRVNYTTGTEPPIQSMYIGDSGLDSGNTAVGSYTIKDTATLVNGIATNDQLVIGTGPGAHGTFLQQDSSSVSSTGTLIVGRRGGVASYTLQGGTITTGSSLVIGDGETAVGGASGTTAGTFTQSGGTVNVGGSFELGRRSGTGVYSISAGSLAVTGQMNVGTTSSTTLPELVNPNGTFNLSGTGSVTTTAGANLFVGFNGGTLTSTAVGTFNVSGGTLTLNNTLVAIGSGPGTTGSFNISGGTVQGNTGVNVEWDIGRTTGNGSVTLSGTGTLKANTILIGGPGSGTTIGNSGTLTVEGGTLNTNNITLASTSVSGANRVLNISGGNVTIGTFNQGAVTPTVPITRTVNISGGTTTVTGATTGGRLVTYNLTGGTTTFQGTASFDTSTLNIGNNANVTFGTLRTQSATTNITGGSTTIANVNDANNEGGNTTISGGTVNVTGLWNVTNATPGTAGSLSITGGNVTINSLTTGGSATLNSSLNISGGTVSIPTLTLSTGSTLKTDNAISLGSAITIGNAGINVNSGSLGLTGSITIPSGGRALTKTGAGTLNLANTWNFNATPGASSITNSAGTVNFNSAIPAGGNVTVNANAATNFAANASLAALNVGAGAKATVVDNGSAMRVVNTTGLVIDANGTVDLKNNKLLTDLPIGTFTGGAYTGVQGEVARAYDFGSWDKPGLMTSMPDAGPLVGTTTIGVSDGASILFIAPTETGTFAGQTVTGATTLAVYTYAGDVNFDGLVDASDYGIIDNYFQFPGTTGYANGDFNYDGVIDAGDYGIIDNTFQLQGAPIPMAGGVAGASLSGVTAVPEPSACGFALLAAARLLTRRTRRTK